MYDNENTGAHTTLDRKVTKIIDDVGGTTIGRPYGGGSYSISNNSKVVYTLTSPYHPSDIGIYSSNYTKRLTNLNYELFKNKDLGEIEDVWYMSSYDGRKIQGWIAKPPGFNPKRSIH